MARLPDELIARIKKEVSLVVLAESQGHELVQQGKEYVLHCPFHDDKTPSCRINPEKNEFNCFGCDAGGSVIDWVMKARGVSFRHAAEILLEANPSLAADSKPVKKTTVPQLECPISTDSSDQQVLSEVIEYYHQALLGSPEALDYLKSRGLNDPELIKEFKLGFANRTLGLRLPRKNRVAGKKLRGQLESIGIYRNSGHEHFNGSLVIPVINDGEVKEVYGRKITAKNKLTPGTPLHLYLPGEHGGVWNQSGLAGHREVILCESLIDAMTFWVHGFKHVTTSYGTQGFTDEHLQCFKGLNIQRILMAYDRDEAGDKASSVLAKKLEAEGFECFSVLFPQGMDANQFVVESENKTEAQERLSEVVRKAEWLGSGKAPERQLTFDQLPPLAAKPTPAPSNLVDEVECVVSDKDITVTFGERVYRVRGFKWDQPSGQLKMNLMVSSEDQFHTDTLDLYQAKQRQVFVNQSSAELALKDEVIKKDLGKVLLKLESLQDEQQKSEAEETSTLTSEQRESALELLQDNNLLQRITNDFNQLGLIGEESNKLVAYLACVSRKLEKPLGVVIQSSSAAGKSSLMDAVLNLMPEEDKVQYSAMTGQSLFYMGETNLKHKILAIAEEEGASNASYALKLLQSEGEITIASTGKDDNTGDLITREYRVEGPTQLLLTTTAIDVDEELMNRCLILSVDESQQQTEAIHAQQRYAETLEGVFAKATKNKLIEQHRHAQRLLKPYAIVNPYAEQLRFLSDKTRTRRDHMKYLTLIKTITLLHQHQREIKTYVSNGDTLEYLEVTLNDIEQANQLMHQVLGKSLDELPPQTRLLLEQIYDWVQGQCDSQKIEPSDFRFSRRDVRELCGWGETQTRLHLQRLAEMEYLLMHRGGRGQSFCYELLYSGEGVNGNAFLLGLLDITHLQSSTTTLSSRGDAKTSRGTSPHLAGSSRPLRGGVAESAKTLEPLSAGVYKETSRVVTESAVQA